jgi:UMF1 family MFS transporter
MSESLLLALPKKKRAIVAWCFYDWATSAFFTVVTTFIFATYFTENIAANKILGTQQWGNAIALSGFLIALGSPIFGAIADHQGRRKPWLGLFTAFAIIGSALLWYAQPGYVYWTLGCVVVGTVGLGISSVFYNAMMRDLSPPGYLGRISGWAWGLGYLGGLSCLIIALYLTQVLKQPIQINGPLVAVWIAVFSSLLFLLTPDQPSMQIRLTTAIREGLSTLIKTLKSLPQRRDILMFLIAQMIYVDGLNTLFAFGGIYAAGTFGMSLSEVMQFGIAMNVVAGLGSMTFGWLDDYVGTKRTILLSLVAMIISGTALLFVQTKLVFWILGLFLCIFIGPAQAASRTLMSRLVPRELSNELFGLYIFSGKATSFLGPLLLGMISYTFNSQRPGMAVIIVFFIIGGLLLLKVPSPNPK